MPFARDGTSRSGEVRLEAASQRLLSVDRLNVCSAFKSGRSRRFYTSRIDARLVSVTVTTELAIESVGERREKFVG